MKCLALVMVLIIAACSSVEMEKSPPVSNDNVEIPDYIIGVGDVLNINVWRNADLTSTVVVRPDGKISMPLVGDINVVRNTTAELSISIEEILKNYVRNPQVTVIVNNPNSADFQSRVRITGAVRKPLSVAYRNGMTALDLVLMAGSLNDYASGNNAKLYRKINGEVKIYPIYFSDLLEDGNLETNYALQPSDVLIIPERTF